MASPMSSAETSTMMTSGKSRGRHSIASDRRFCSRSPPIFFTPFAIPVGSSGTSCSRPPFCREFYLFSHVRILFAAIVINLELRGNRFVVVNSFHAFTEKLGDAKHGGLKSLHRPHRRAVRGY